MDKGIEALIADMKAAAEKATPGRIGDRIDGSGSIKYECLGLDKTLVLRTDHKNMEYGFIGDNGDADEVFFRLSSPENVLALIAALEQAQRQNGYLREQSAEWERKAISNFEECSEMSVRIEELESQRKLAFTACNRWRDKCADAEKRIAELESAPNGVMQLSNELAEMKRECVELQEQKDKWAAWAIALGAKADELESRPLCVKSNDAMREAVPLCVKLPDGSNGVRKL